MTIKDILNRAAEERPSGVALKYKRGGTWETRSFSELRERAWHVSEMLMELGVQAGDRISIFRENSPEWFELYYGIVSLGAIAVPADAKLREMELAHILHDCGVSVVFCSTRHKDMLNELRNRLHEVHAVVVLDTGSSHLPEGLLDYEQLREKVSAAALADTRAFDQLNPAVDAAASFLYTSGTTGRPKGAMLTHRNFMANVEAISSKLDIGKSDNFMLILPLHHSFAFTSMLLLPIYAQCQVSFVENLKAIKDSMVECSPTALLAVPLMLEKMLGRIMNGIHSNRLSSLMYRCGLAKVIGRKVHAGLGGALRVIVSGAAPIHPATLNAWSKLGFNIIEGYGITETAPVLTLNPLDAPRVGTVGLPLEGVEIKIFEPNAEGVGEITAYGENVMQGYYNNPEETEKVLIDGRYHTGDLGYLDEKGYLVISGRKKSLIVNREGKNIYPEEIERQVLKSDYALECLALGYRESTEETGERVGLIVVPDQAVFESMEDHKDTRLSDGEIEEMVRNDIQKLLGELSNYKRPRKIEVRFDEFEKTTTQKIKRYLYAIDTSAR